MIIGSQVQPALVHTADTEWLSFLCLHGSDWKFHNASKWAIHVCHLVFSSGLIFTVDRGHLKKVAHAVSGISPALLEFGPSLLEKSKTKCWVTAFMGFLGDNRWICQEIKDFARNHLGPITIHSLHMQNKLWHRRNHIQYQLNYRNIVEIFFWNVNHQWLFQIWWGNYFICLHFDSKWLDFWMNRMSTPVSEPITENWSDWTIRQVIRQVTTKSHWFPRDSHEVNTCGMMFWTISQWVLASSK